jgi:hypothetical protein
MTKPLTLEQKIAKTRSALKDMLLAKRAEKAAKSGDREAKAFARAEAKAIKAAAAESRKNDRAAKAALKEGMKAIKAENAVARLKARDEKALIRAARFAERELKLAAKKQAVMDRLDRMEKRLIEAKVKSIVVGSKAIKAARKPSKVTVVTA